MEDEFDPRAATRQHYQSITKTMTASMETFEAVIGSDSGILHRHHEKIQVLEQVQRVRFDAFSEHLGPDSPPPVEEESFRMSDLHELLQEEPRKVAEGEHGQDSVSSPRATGAELDDWNRQNVQQLETKHNQEKTKLEALIAAANDFKQEFYARRDKHWDAVKRGNRDKQKRSSENRDRFHASASINYWQSVSELIDPEPENKKPIAVYHGPKPGKPTDLARMRQVIFKLRNRKEDQQTPEDEPDSHRVAATA